MFDDTEKLLQRMVVFFSNITFLKKGNYVEYIVFSYYQTKSEITVILLHNYEMLPAQQG